MATSRKQTLSAGVVNHLRFLQRPGNLGDKPDAPQFSERLAEGPESIIGQGVGSRDHASTQVHTQLGRAAVQTLAANDRMNQLLIERLDPAAWRVKPPGPTRNITPRTIAAIFTVGFTL
jgi:hypothetical protein